jgi:hypothetical protein
MSRALAKLSIIYCIGEHFIIRLRKCCTVVTAESETQMESTIIVTSLSHEFNALQGNQRHVQSVVDKITDTIR